MNTEQLPIKKQIKTLCAAMPSNETALRDEVCRALEVVADELERLGVQEIDHRDRLAEAEAEIVELQEKLAAAGAGTTTTETTSTTTTEPTP